MRNLLESSPLLALEVNERMQTVLHVAASRKDMAEMIECLLKLDWSGILLKSKDMTGKTPLQIAQEKGHKEIV